MATEQQLAQALSPYDPNYLQNLALGQGTPSLLGNTTTVQPRPVNNLALLENTGDVYSDPNPGWSGKTDAEKAAFYGENPTFAGITQMGQKGFGLTSLGMLQNALNPSFVSNQGLIAMGVDPAAYQGARESFRSSEMGEQNAVNNAVAMQSMQDALAADTAAAQQAARDTVDRDQGAAVGSDTGYSGGTTGAGNEGGGIGAGEGLAQGGKVNRNHLTGPDPKGPDDGYGALQGGEYVIKKAAVRKYGEGMLGKINSGKFSKQ